MMSLLSSLFVVGVVAAEGDSLPRHVEEFKTTCKIFGDGAKAVRVVLKYDAKVRQSSLRKETYSIEGKQIKQIYVSKSAEERISSKDGHFVIIELEAKTDIKDKPRPPMTEAQKAQRAERDKQMGGPGLKAGWSTGGGDLLGDSVVLRQTLAIKTSTGQTYPAESQSYVGRDVHYLVADDFSQHEFRSPYTGAILPYNLYLPKGYDPTKKYPLVLFIHDAGVASGPVKSTLLQGRGAVTWAEESFQSENPCIVVAPQYPFVTVDDSWNYSHHLDATVALIRDLQKTYSVDSSRIYTTGQSMGCMSSMVLLLKEPDLFAGALLVAGKWNPEVLASLKDHNLWIISCEGDRSSTELQNKAVTLWRNLGATVSEQTWGMESSPEEFTRLANEQMSEGGHLYYSHLTGGSHRGTWAVAYDIAPVKSWLLQQRKR